jgi:hypothetical protein
LGFGPSGKSPPNAPKHSSASSGQQLRFISNYGKLPLAFEPNQGQTAPQVKFLVRGRGYTLFVTPQEAVLSLKKPQPFLEKRPRPKGFAVPTPDPKPPTVLRLKLEGVQANQAFEPLEQLPGISNYFIGKDPAQWHTNIPQYSKVAAHNVYPGVDMVYYGNQGKLEFDFQVKPGADPKAILMKVEGAQDVQVNGQGDLELRTVHGKLVFRAPTVYHEAGGQKNAVEGRYKLEDGNRVGFEVRDYDKSKTLVIDPQLDYSTYLGGNPANSTFWDECLAIAVNGSGNAYVTGWDSTTDFPTTSGAYQTTSGSLGSTEAFVSELKADGSGLVYSTYLGGISSGSTGYGMALDGAGNAYLTGNAGADFPTTGGAYQTSNGSAFSSAFISKLSGDGLQLLYSTFLGGSNFTEGFGIALDAGENAYVTGTTADADFPTTAGAYQTVDPGPSYPHAFAAKLNLGGNGNADLVYSTYLGGGNTFSVNGEQGSAIAVDGNGIAYLAGYSFAGNFPTTTGAYQTVAPSPGNFQGIVSKLSADGHSLLYSSYLGGSNQTGCYSIALDASGNAYLTGYTQSSNFPTTAGAFQTTFSGGFTDAFVVKMNLGGNGNLDLLYSTYLGGGGTNNGAGIATDGNGNIYVTGWAQTNFPTTSGAYQTTNVSLTNFWNAYVTKLNPGGNGNLDLVYSTYLGGNSQDNGQGIALDNNGDVLITGFTSSTNFSTTSGAFQPADPNSYGSYTGFVAKFDAIAFGNLTPTPTVTPAISPTFTPTPTPTPPPSTYTPTPTPPCEIHVWPDPFNPNYAFGGALKMSCLPVGVTVSFYTLSGELVNQVDEAGGMAQWNGTNRQGIFVSSGIYFYVIQNGDNVLAKGKFLVNR